MKFTSIRNLLGLKPKSQEKDKKSNNLKDFNAPVTDASVIQTNYEYINVPSFRPGLKTMKNTSTSPKRQTVMPHHSQASRNVNANTSMIRKPPSKGGKSQRRRKHRKTVKKGYFW